MKTVANQIRLIASLMEEVKKHGPLKMNDKSFDFRDEYHKRNKFTKDYAWAVPNEEALDKIKEFTGGSKVLEIGSGLGLWAKLLQDIGVSVTPTNPSKIGDHYLSKEKKPYTYVHDMDHNEALKAFGSAHDTLMMIWPPYSDSMAYEALKAFKGNKLIYVGESGGGCTGDDKFHELLYDDWKDAGEVRIPQWDGIHDWLYLYKRKYHEGTA